MKHLGKAFDSLRDEQSDVRCKRLLFRCWHRGAQENEVSVGGFDRAVALPSAPRGGPRARKVAMVLDLLRPPRDRARVQKAGHCD
jgi:hypothetical protein